MKRRLSLRGMLRLITLMAWLVSLAWLFYDPGFKPLVAFLTGAAAFAGSFVVSDKPITFAQVSEEEERGRDRRNRQAMLTLVKWTWIDNVLDKSLHNAVLIELGLEERRAAVHGPDRPWDMVLKTVDKPNRLLAPGTRIVDVFDDARQALLILGEPGSGKTTTLLELARETISRAETDSTQAIPVAFNLSSWGDPDQSIAAWLVGELNTKYNIPRKIATPWVEHDQLLLLLDGLDEVAPQRRDRCVEAINEFRREHLAQLVVCSRTAEYQSLTTLLKLHSAVCIQPLTEKQIGDYLDELGARFAGVRDILRNDKPMRELSRSPLMLSIMTLAYKGASTEEIQQLDTLEARREHLLNKYIDRMFNRVARAKTQPYPREKTTKWLSWLAERMSEKTQSVFLIERTQPSWLQTRGQYRQYRMGEILVHALVFALTIGPIFALIVGLILGLTVGLIHTLRLGLIVGLIGGPMVALIGRAPEGPAKTIETVESLNWSWEQATRGLIVGLIHGLRLGLIVGLIGGLIGGLAGGLTVGLIVGLSVGLIGALILSPIEWAVLSGLGSAEVEERTVPNQGIRQSIRNAALACMAITIGSMLLVAPVARLLVAWGPNFGLDALVVVFSFVLLLYVGPVLGVILAQVTQLTG